MYLRMGKNLVLWLTTVVVLALPAAALAQPGIPSPEPLPLPLEMLLEQRGPLELTGDQVGQLDQIQAGLASRNEPLVAQMMTLREQWQHARNEGRRGRQRESAERLERIRTAAQELRNRIQENNRAAMQRVNRLLTAKQRKQLRAIVEERRQVNPGRRGRGGSDADRRR